MNFLWFILIGLFAGALAGTVIKGSGFGVIGDIFIGVFGSILGGILFSTFGSAPNPGLVGSLLVATCGAIFLLLSVRIIKVI